MSEWLKGLKSCENMIKSHESIKDGCIAAHDYFVRELYGGHSSGNIIEM